MGIRAALLAGLVLPGMVLGWGCQQASAQLATTSASRPAVALSSRAYGEVQLQSGAAGWIDVAMDHPLRAGDRLRTGPRGFARVELLRGPALSLSEGSTIELSGSEAMPLLRLASGRAQVDLDGSRSIRSKLQVVVGSGEVVELESDQTTTTVQLAAVERGLDLATKAGSAKVRVASTPGSASAVGERQIPSGSGLAVRGAQLGEVLPLPSPPVAHQPGPDARFYCPGIVLGLQWNQVESAAGYLLEVAQDPSFERLRYSRAVKGTTALFLPGTPHTYFWRVAARSAEGQLGHFSQPRALFCEPSEPKDLLTRPGPGDSINAPSGKVDVDFSWTPVEGGERYRLVVDHTPSLRSPKAISISALTHSASASGLEPGEYFWGVYSEDHHARPLFLEPRPFTVRKRAQNRFEVPENLANWGQ